MREHLVKAAFIIPVLWWVYLFFTTQIVIVFDSEGYESVGRMIYLQGWQEFFRSGPHREPFFFILIALSMWMGDIFNVSYFYPLKFFGLIFLFATMVISYRLMRMLGIHRLVAAAAVFYLGISPVMTNASLRLWSEFAVFPFVVLAVWWTVKSWQFLMRESSSKKEIGETVLRGAGLGIIFLLIMSVKAVAEPILMAYLWPFYWQIFVTGRANDYLKMKHLIIFCLAVFLIFEGVLAGYKLINYQHNGQYEYTTRWDWALWGYAKRRAEPLTLKSLGAAVAFVPGTDLCIKTFGNESCEFWSARYSDDLDVSKSAELTAEGLNEAEKSKRFVRDSLKEMAATPLQQAGLMLIEAHKIFFWESSLAFVAYPDWIENIFYLSPWMNRLKYALAGLGWLASLFAIYYLCRRKTSVGIKEPTRKDTLLFVVNFLFWYTAAYSLYFIVDRYSFPVISLLIVLIAFMVDKWVIKKYE
jgi:hypothetical protein